MAQGKPLLEDGRLKEELDGFSFTALALPDNWSRPSSAAGSPRCACDMCCFFLCKRAMLAVSSWSLMSYVLLVCRVQSAREKQGRYAASSNKSSSNLQSPTLVGPNSPAISKAGSKPRSIAQTLAPPPNVRQQAVPSSTSPAATVAMGTPVIGGQELAAMAYRATVQAGKTFA